MKTAIVDGFGILALLGLCIGLVTSGPAMYWGLGMACVSALTAIAVNGGAVWMWREITRKETTEEWWDRQW